MKNFYLFFLFSTFISSCFGQNFKTESLQILKNQSVQNALLDSTYRKLTKDTVALKRLLQESKTYKNPTVEIFALNKLGVFFRDHSLYDKALIYHKKALETAEANKNYEQIIISNNQLGVIYRRRDEIIPAIFFHQKALELAEKMTKPDETILRNIAISCNSLGNVYLTINQLDDAMSYFRRSLEIEKKVGNNLGLAINYQNIGGIFEKKKQLDNALKNYQQSLYYNNKINSDLGRLICNNSIGAIYLKQNKIALAKEYLMPTIQEAENFDDDFYSVMSYINTGWLYLLESNPAAEKTLKKGLEIAEKKKFTSSKIDAYELLSKLYEKQNKLDSSLAYYKKYASEKEFLNSENTMKSVSDLKNKYTLEKRKNEINTLKNEHDKILIKLNNNKTIFSILFVIASFFILSAYFLARQKQLKQEKKMLIMEQDLLRLQINPHFIFNALNSIKAYIVKNDTKNSVFYLNKFASIFRNILSAIHQKETNLKEELETLENYISLENMRFGGTINYSIKVDETIDLEKVQIPALLLQVFVENTVWHGLALKEGEKILTIDIAKINPRKIFIEITDNGIGRDKSAALKTFNRKQKESLGLKISGQRLENFYAQQYSLKIIDLKDSDNQPTGTSVQLEIPDCTHF